MDKDRQIISELRIFFTESGCGLGVQRIMNVLGTINITERQMAFEKKPNCKLTCAQVILMMILFSFFSVNNAANYFGSSLQTLFDCRKDMFYRVLSNENIDRRHILKTSFSGELFKVHLKLLIISFNQSHNQAKMA